MKIINNLTPYNHDKGLLKDVRGIVLHSMWGTHNGSITWFHNPASKASAHFCISAEGEIVRTVNETDIAWHAGVIDNIGDKFPWVLPNPNWYTLGIEIEDKRDAHWIYPEPQRKAVRELVEKLQDQFNIPDERVVLHRWLNPSRRSDPVGNFSFEWVFPKTSSDPIITDQTKIDMGENFGVMEVQAIRSTINDQAKNIETLKENQEDVVRNAITEAEKKLNNEWQLKLESANAEIDRLHQTISENQEKKLEEYHWKVLLIQAIRNFKGGERA